MYFFFSAYLFHINQKVIIGSLERKKKKKTRSFAVWRFERTAAGRGTKIRREFVRSMLVIERQSGSERGSLIFVGCASRSPSAYERGINYPGASVWSLLRPLTASLSLFATHRSLSLSLSLAPSPFVRLSYSACSGNHSLLSFVHPSPSRSLPPPELSIMTPRGGTIPEVKSERRNHDVHSMESLSSTGTGYSKVATHARSLACPKENPLLSTGARSAFAWTRVTREQLPGKSRVV